MTQRHEASTVRPATLAWVRRQLGAGERIVGAEALQGGITAEVRRLTVATPDGGRRYLVLRGFAGPAEDGPSREAVALTLLAGTDVPAPALVAVDATAAHCEQPSLLATWLPGRPVLADRGLVARLPLLARQLVAIHAVRPAEAERPRPYVALSTADTAVRPPGADSAVWAEAVTVVRRPRPPYQGRFLHRDFHPGNVLFDGPGITGVVDWATASWGPADLDVAHCAVNLALLHGPEWGLRFAEAYQEAGGALAADPDERRYWLVRDALACSEELAQIARPWRAAGRPELTTRAVGQRLDAYLAALLDTPPQR
ncbi:aminoglycoside phosphotransferase family protein [Kitasatospora sp. NPDC002227]|uniref:phosphotransferase family protein n=1 Tax=Kitasatospora sp. NPDC002227 TaxID=3154773 RepID=UPI003332B9FF